MRTEKSVSSCQQTSSNTFRALQNCHQTQTVAVELKKPVNVGHICQADCSCHGIFNTEICGLWNSMPGMSDRGHQQPRFARYWKVMPEFLSQSWQPWSPRSLSLQSGMLGMSSKDSGTLPQSCDSKPQEPSAAVLIMSLSNCRGNAKI